MDEIIMRNFYKEEQYRRANKSGIPDRNYTAEDMEGFKVLYGDLDEKQPKIKPEPENNEEITF